jgi:hypothetical protein
MASFWPNSPSSALCREMAFFGTPFSFLQQDVHASMATFSFPGGNFGPDGLFLINGFGRELALGGRPSKAWPGSGRLMQARALQ